MKKIIILVAVLLSSCSKNNDIQPYHTPIVGSPLPTKHYLKVDISYSPDFNYQAYGSPQINTYINNVPTWDTQYGSSSYGTKIEIVKGDYIKVKGSYFNDWTNYIPTITIDDSIINVPSIVSIFTFEDQY